MKTIKYRLYFFLKKPDYIDDGNELHLDAYSIMLRLITFGLPNIVVHGGKNESNSESLDATNWFAIGKLLQPEFIRFTNVIEHTFKLLDTKIPNNLIDPINVLQKLVDWMSRMQIKGINAPPFNQIIVTEENLNLVATQIMEYILILEQATRSGNHLQRLITTLEEHLGTDPKFTMAFAGNTPQEKLQSLFMFVALQTRIILSALLPKIGILTAIYHLQDDIFNHFRTYMTDRMKNKSEFQDIIKGLDRIQDLYHKLRIISDTILADDVSYLKARVNLPAITEFLDKLDLDKHTQLSPSQTEILHAIILLTGASDMIGRLGKINTELGEFLKKEKLNLNYEKDLKTALYYIIDNRNKLAMDFEPGDIERLSLFAQALSIMGNDITVISQKVTGGAISREKGVPMLYLPVTKTEKITELLNTTERAKQYFMMQGLLHNANEITRYAQYFIKHLFPMPYDTAVQVIIHLNAIGKLFQKLPKATAYFNITYALVHKSSPIVLGPTMKHIYSVFNDLLKHYQQISHHLKQIKNPATSILTSQSLVQLIITYLENHLKLLHNYQEQIAKLPQQKQSTLLKVKGGNDDYVYIEPYILSIEGGKTLLRKIPTNNTIQIPINEVDPGAAIILPTELCCDGNDIIGGNKIRKVPSKTRASAQQGAMLVAEQKWTHPHFYLTHSVGDEHKFSSKLIGAAKNTITADRKKHTNLKITKDKIKLNKKNLQGGFEDPDSIIWDETISDFDKEWPELPQQKNDLNSAYGGQTNESAETNLHLHCQCAITNNSNCACQSQNIKGAAIQPITALKTQIQIISPRGGQRLYADRHYESLKIKGGNINITHTPEQVSQYYKLYAEMMSTRLTGFTPLPSEFEQTQRQKNLENSKRAMVKYRMERLQPTNEQLNSPKLMKLELQGFPNKSQNDFLIETQKTSEVINKTIDNRLDVLTVFLDYIPPVINDIIKVGKENPGRIFELSAYTRVEEEITHFKQFFTELISIFSTIVTPLHVETNVVENYLNHDMSPTLRQIPNKNNITNDIHIKDAYGALQPNKCSTFLSKFQKQTYNFLTPFLFNHRASINALFPDSPKHHIEKFNLILMQFGELMLNAAFDYNENPPMLFQIHFPTETSCEISEPIPLQNDNIVDSLAQAYIRNHIKNQPITENNNIVIPIALSPIDYYITGRSNVLPELFITNLIENAGPVTQSQTFPPINDNIPHENINLYIRENILPTFNFTSNIRNTLQPQPSPLAAFFTTTYNTGNSNVIPPFREAFYILPTSETDITSGWPNNKQPRIYLLNNIAPAMATLNSEILYKGVNAILALAATNLGIILLNNGGINRVIDTTNSARTLHNAMLFFGGDPKEVSGLVGQRRNSKQKSPKSTMSENTNTSLDSDIEILPDPEPLSLETLNSLSISDLPNPENPKQLRPDVYFSVFRTELFTHYKLEDLPIDEWPPILRNIATVIGISRGQDFVRKGIHRARNYYTRLSNKSVSNNLLKGGANTFTLPVIDISIVAIDKLDKFTQKNTRDLYFGVFVVLYNLELIKQMATIHPEYILFIIYKGADINLKNLLNLMHKHLFELQMHDMIGQTNAKTTSINLKLLENIIIVMINYVTERNQTDNEFYDELSLAIHSSLRYVEPGNKKTFMENFILGHPFDEEAIFTNQETQNRYDDANALLPDDLSISTQMYNYSSKIPSLGNNLLNQTNDQISQIAASATLDQSGELTPAKFGYERLIDSMLEIMAHQVDVQAFNSPWKFNTFIEREHKHLTKQTTNEARLNMIIDNLQNLFKESTDQNVLSGVTIDSPITIFLTMHVTLVEQLDILGRLAACAFILDINTQLHLLIDIIKARQIVSVYKNLQDIITQIRSNQFDNATILEQAREIITTEKRHWILSLAQDLKNHVIPNNREIQIQLSENDLKLTIVKDPQQIPNISLTSPTLILVNPIPENLTSIENALTQASQNTWNDFLNNTVTGAIIFMLYTQNEDGSTQWIETMEYIRKQNRYNETQLHTEFTTHLANTIYRILPIEILTYFIKKIHGNITPGTHECISNTTNWNINTPLSSYFNEIFNKFYGYINFDNQDIINTFTTQLYNIIPFGRVLLTLLEELTALTNTNLFGKQNLMSLKFQSNQIVFKCEEFLLAIRTQISTYIALRNNLSTKLSPTFVDQLSNLTWNNGNLKLESILYLLNQPVSISNSMAGYQYIEQQINNNLNFMYINRIEIDRYFRQINEHPGIEILTPFVMALFPCASHPYELNELYGLSKSMNDYHQDTLPYKYTAQPALPQPSLPISRLSWLGMTLRSSYENKMGIISNALTRNYIGRINQLINMGIHSAVWQYGNSRVVDWQLCIAIYKRVQRVATKTYPDYLPSIISVENYQFAVQPTTPDFITMSQGIKLYPLLNVNARDSHGGSYFRLHEQTTQPVPNYRHFVMGLPPIGCILTTSVVDYIYGLVTQMGNSPQSGAIPDQPTERLLDLQAMTPEYQNRAIANRTMLYEGLIIIADQLRSMEGMLQYLKFLIDTNTYQRTTPVFTPNQRDIALIVNPSPPSALMVNTATDLMFQPQSIEFLIATVQNMLKFLDSLSEDIKTIIIQPVENCFNVPSDILIAARPSINNLKRPSTLIPALLTSDIVLRPTAIPNVYQNTSFELSNTVKYTIIPPHDNPRESQSGDTTSIQAMNTVKTRMSDIGVWMDNYSAHRTKMLTHIEAFINALTSLASELLQITFYELPQKAVFQPNFELYQIDNSPITDELFLTGTLIHRDHNTPEELKNTILKWMNSVNQCLAVYSDDRAITGLMAHPNPQANHENYVQVVRWLLNLQQTNMQAPIDLNTYVSQMRFWALLTAVGHNQNYNIGKDLIPINFTVHQATISKFSWPLHTLYTHVINLQRQFLGVLEQDQYFSLHQELITATISEISQDLNELQKQIELAIKMPPKPIDPSIAIRTATPGEFTLRTIDVDMRSDLSLLIPSIVIEPNIWPSEMIADPPLPSILLPLQYNDITHMGMLNNNHYENIKTTYAMALQGLNAILYENNAAQLLFTESSTLARLITTPSTFGSNLHFEYKHPERTPINIPNPTTPLLIMKDELSPFGIEWGLPGHMNERANLIVARLIAPYQIHEHSDVIIKFMEALYNKLTTGSKHIENIIGNQELAIIATAIRRLGIRRRIHTLWFEMPTQHYPYISDLPIPNINTFLPSFLTQHNLTFQQLILNIIEARQYHQQELARLIQFTNDQRIPHNVQLVDNNSKPIFKIMAGLMWELKLYQIMRISPLLSNLVTDAEIAVRAYAFKDYIASRYNVGSNFDNTPNSITNTTQMLYILATQPMTTISYRKFIDLALPLYYGKTTLYDNAIRPLNHIFGANLPIYLSGPRNEEINIHKLQFLTHNHIQQLLNNPTDLALYQISDQNPEDSFVVSIVLTENNCKEVLKRAIHAQQMAYTAHETIAMRLAIQQILLIRIIDRIALSNSLLDQKLMSPQERKAMELFQTRLPMVL